MCLSWKQTSPLCHNKHFYGSTKGQANRLPCPLSCHKCQKRHDNSRFKNLSLFFFFFASDICSLFGERAQAAWRCLHCTAALHRCSWSFRGPLLHGPGVPIPRMSRIGPLKSTCLGSCLQMRTPGIPQQGWGFLGIHIVLPHQSWSVPLSVGKPKG